MLSFGCQTIKSDRYGAGCGSVIGGLCHCRDYRDALAHGSHVSVFVNLCHGFVGRAPDNAAFRSVGGGHRCCNRRGRVGRSIKRQFFPVKRNIDRQHHDNIAVVRDKGVFIHVIGVQLPAFVRPVTAQPVKVALRDSITAARHYHFPVRVLAVVGTNPAGHTQIYAVRQRPHKLYRSGGETAGVFTSVNIQIIENVLLIVGGIGEYPRISLKIYNAGRCAENSSPV